MERRYVREATDVREQDFTQGLPRSDSPTMGETYFCYKSLYRQQYMDIHRLTYIGNQS
jgi:hypothetical protein